MKIDLMVNLKLFNKKNYLSIKKLILNKEFLKNYLLKLSQHPSYTLFSEHHNILEKEVLKEIGITNV